MAMDRHIHIFQELPSAASRKGYFKRLPDGQYDQSLAYTMLFCTECGETKEVVAADHTHFTSLVDHSHHLGDR